MELARKESESYAYQGLISTNAGTEVKSYPGRWN